MIPVASDQARRLRVAQQILSTCDQATKLRVEDADSDRFWAPLNRRFAGVESPTHDRLDPKNASSGSGRSTARCNGN